MGAWQLGFLVVIGGTGLSVLGMLLVRKRINFSYMESHHEVAGYLISIVGTLYAVLLGLVVVDVQSKYYQAQIMAETEANAVVDLYHLCNKFETSTRDEIHKQLRNYVDVVLDEEWNSNKEDTLNKGSLAPLHKLWEAVENYEPKSNRDQALYSTCLTALGQLADSRRFRAVTTRTGVSPVLWLVLISGGISTVVFTYFFGVQNLRVQIIMTTLVAICLSLNVMLVALFSNPYRGELRISPNGFLYDKRMIEQLEQQKPNAL